MRTRNALLLAAAVFLGTLGFLCLDEVLQDSTGIPEASAQITTFRPISSFPQVTTMDAGTARLLLSVVNTSSLVSRQILATNAFRWFVSTTELAARGYLTTVNLSPYLMTVDLAPYLTTFDASGYLTTVNLVPYLTTFDASPYITSANLGLRQYVSTTELAGRGYLTSFDASAYLPTASLDASRTWATPQTFGALTTGALGRRVFPPPSNLANGDWVGDAQLLNVAGNVTTYAILGMNTLGLAYAYSSLSTMAGKPSALALTAITTAAPGLCLLNGGVLRAAALGVGSTNLPVDWYASTTAGAFTSAVPGNGQSRVYVWQRIATNTIRLLFGYDWR
jgi:hypothetical protein